MFAESALPFEPFKQEKALWKMEQEAESGHPVAGEEQREDSGEKSSEDSTVATDVKGVDTNKKDDGESVADTVTDKNEQKDEPQKSSNPVLSRKARMEKLKERRREARKLNHAEVVEEDRRMKLPANYEARKRKIEWEITEEEARKQAEEEGEDYERVKLMDMSATEMERSMRKKKKKNPDTGFADFAQAQHRQYERLTKQMEPNMEAYEKQKQEMGESFYPGVNTLIHGRKDSEAAINRMVADLEKQVEKRSKYSRRRAFNEEEDVDYINDRNMRFNKKAARFYDEYTAEIKQNLERGTAV